MKYYFITLFLALSSNAFSQCRIMISVERNDSSFNPMDSDKLLKLIVKKNYFLTDTDQEINLKLNLIKKRSIAKVPLYQAVVSGTFLDRENRVIMYTNRFSRPTKNLNRAYTYANFEKSLLNVVDELSPCTQKTNL